MPSEGSRCAVESGQEGMFVLCSYRRLSVPPSLERQKPSGVIPAEAKRRAGIHEHHGPKKRATGDLRHDQSSCSWIPGSPCGSPSTNARVCTGNDEAPNGTPTPAKLAPMGFQPATIGSQDAARMAAIPQAGVDENGFGRTNPFTKCNALKRDPPDSRLPTCERKVTGRSQDGCYPAGERPDAGPAGVEKRLL